MNDEEIKKCLEYCVAKGQCKKCPLDKELLCFPVLEKNALDLINRQQAEIERLNGNLFTISNACMQRRNEAIKEFAERLRLRVIKTRFDAMYGAVIEISNDTITELVKEMAGGEDA